jgi:hypothetical protein
VGSADGYVERFYRNNGYKPVEYLLHLPPEHASQLAAGGARAGPAKEGVCRVYLPIAGAYDPADKHALAQATGGHPTVVFAKNLTIYPV